MKKKKQKLLSIKKGVGRQKKKNFKYRNKKIEVVKNYTYLGIPQTYTASSEASLRGAISSAALATSSSISIINRMELNSWEPIPKIFNSLVSSTFLYAIQIWGLRYLNEIEKPQTTFYKKLLLLPQNTPNYAIRLETGSQKIACKVFKLTLNLIEKILNMGNERYPKICLLQLINQLELSKCNTKYNWCAQVKKMFEDIGETIVWTLEFIQENKERLIKTYENYSRAEDVNSLSNSSSLQILPNLTLRDGTQTYLRMKLPLLFIKVFAQIRLINKYNPRIIYKKEILNLNDNYCCGEQILKGKELYHMLIECQMYKFIRKKYVCDSEDESLIKDFCIDLLNDPNPNGVKSINFYIKNVIKKLG